MSTPQCRPISADNLGPSLRDARRFGLFQQTVPRRLVHRTAVAEVFVTGLRQVSDALFHVAGQWPRTHAYFEIRNGRRHDPFLFLETIRQAGLLVAHTGLGVPVGHQFLFHRNSYTVDPRGLACGDRPVEVLIAVSVPPRSERRTGRRQMTFSCTREDAHTGSAAVAWSAVSPAVYARIRGGRPAPSPTPQPRPVAAELVGRRRGEDVVLSPTDDPRAWLLRINHGHPVMFDHPVDHVPGMVAMEAVRQAAMLATGRPSAVARSGTFAFHRYIELDRPCVVSVDATGATGRIRVRLRQGGQTVGDCALDLHTDE